MIKRSTTQEDIIILDISKGHVSIPDILIGREPPTSGEGWGSSCETGEVSRKHSRSPLQRHWVCIQEYIQRHGVKYLTLECSGKSRGCLKQICTTSLPFCSQGYLLLAFAQD